MGQLLEDVTSQDIGHDNIRSLHQGPERSSRDSGFKFQTDRGFWIQIKKLLDSGLKILIRQD